MKTKFGHCNNCQKNSLNFGLCKYCDSYYLCADCIKNQKFDKNHDVSLNFLSYKFFIKIQRKFNFLSFLKCTKVFNIEKSRASKSVVKFAPDLPNEKICRMCKNQLKGFKIKYTKDDNLCFDCWNNNKTKLTDQFELIAAGFCDFCGLTFKDNVDHCFHCIVCDSYDLCLKCYTNGYFSKKHTLNHPVLTKRTPWKYSQ